MNVLSIDVERHCLMIILVLSVFFIVEIQEKRMANEKLNDLADRSQILLISAIFMKLFSFLVSNEIVENSFTFIFFSLNIVFFCEIVFKIIEYQYGNFGKKCKFYYFYVCYALFMV